MIDHDAAHILARLLIAIFGAKRASWGYAVFVSIILLAFSAPGPARTATPGAAPTATVPAPQATPTRTPSASPQPPST